jgi:hypothetical protein
MLALAGPAAIPPLFPTAGASDLPSAVSSGTQGAWRALVGASNGDGSDVPAARKEDAVEKPAHKTDWDPRHFRVLLKPVDRFGLTDEVQLDIVNQQGRSVAEATLFPNYQGYLRANVSKHLSSMMPSIRANPLFHGLIHLANDLGTPLLVVPQSRDVNQQSALSRVPRYLPTQNGLDPLSPILRVQSKQLGFTDFRRDFGLASKWAGAILDMEGIREYVKAYPTQTVPETPLGWRWPEHYPDFTINRQIKVLSNADKSMIGKAELDGPPFPAVESSFLGTGKAYVQTITGIDDQYQGESDDSSRSPLLDAILMRLFQTQSSAFIPAKEQDLDVGISSETLHNVGFKFGKLGKTPKKKTGWFLNSVNVTGYGVSKGFSPDPLWIRAL